MRKIGDKSSILSPITGFQTQKPFRKPSDSSPQEPAITSKQLVDEDILEVEGEYKNRKYRIKQVVF